MENKLEMDCLQGFQKKQNDEWNFIRNPLQENFIRNDYETHNQYGMGEQTYYQYGMGDNAYVLLLLSLFLLSAYFFNSVIIRP